MSSEPKTAAEGARVENSLKTTLSSYWEKIIACQAVELADLWREYGEAAPLVKRLADIEWDRKIQRNMGGDPLQAYRDRRDLIQIICTEYTEVAKKLELQSQGSLASNNEEAAQSVESKSTNKQQKPLTDREQKIWGVIQHGSVGAQYLRELHDAGLRPPKRWVERGCPGTYRGIAAEKSNWRQSAYDEKCKVRRKAQGTR